MKNSLTLVATAATAITLAACSSPTATESASTSAAAAAAPTAEASTTGDSSRGGTPITITSGDQNFSATLNDSITIIYEETSSVPTLTKMGEITSGLDSFEELPDNVDLRIELG